VEIEDGGVYYYCEIRGGKKEAGKKNADSVYFLKKNIFVYLFLFHRLLRRLLDELREERRRRRRKKDLREAPP
jgi:hypothetical protein